MKAYTLFSGSSGNCFFLDGGDTKILIDCGVSARAAETSLRLLGSSFDDISAIFITHEHIDHVKGLEVISKHHDIPIYMTEKSARAMIKDNSPVLHNLNLFDTSGFTVDLGRFTVQAFRTPHDSVSCVGYTVADAEGEKIGYATDIGSITDEVTEAMTGCNSVVIEANHDERMLMLGPYPYELKMRVLSDNGHLSNAMSGKLAKTLAERGTSHFLLAHISKENNSAELAAKTVREALSGYPETTVAAAGRSEITELIL